MSGIYHVLFLWTASGSALRSAYHLIFCSRYDADEFYRVLPEIPWGTGKLFTHLERKSPQFWSYDSVDTLNAVWRIMENGLLPDFKGRWTQHRIADFTVALPLFQAITGPDWLSGGTFFIRNRRQPNVYWWVHDTHIHTSEQRRTKFRVQQEVSSGNDAVLNRADKITVLAIPETVTAVAASLGTQFVSIRASKSNSLHLSNLPYKWTFGGLLNKDIGVRWGNEIASEEGQPAKPLLVYMTDGGGDEWELC